MTKNRFGAALPFYPGFWKENQKKNPYLVNDCGSLNFYLLARFPKLQSQCFELLVQLVPILDRQNKIPNGTRRKF